MNDVERELRELLERKAGSVGGVAPRLPEKVRKRGRRRQAGTAAIGTFTVAAVALVSIAGFRAIDLGRADGGVPADDPWAGYEIFERTATIENFTITSPSDWYLVNQWPLGAQVATSTQSGTCEAVVAPPPGEIASEPPGTNCKTSSPVPVPFATPVPIVLLSNRDLGLGTSPCLTGGTGLRGDDAVLEIAADTTTLSSAASLPTDDRRWPVALSEGVDDGPCGRGHYVRFTDGRTSFLAWTGFGPDATNDDRRLLFSAFAEMDVVKWEPRAPDFPGPGYVIAGGENAAGPWRLELRPSTGKGPNTNVDLARVQSEVGISGQADFTVPESASIEFKTGDPTFGAVTKEATGVELRLEEGTPPIPANLVPLPPSLAYPFDLFFASNDSDVPATAVALGIDREQPVPTDMPEITRVVAEGVIGGSAWALDYEEGRQLSLVGSNNDVLDRIEPDLLASLSLDNPVLIGVHDFGTPDRQRYLLYGMTQHDVDQLSIVLFDGQIITLERGTLRDPSIRIFGRNPNSSPGVWWVEMPQGPVVAEIVTFDTACDVIDRAELDLETTSTHTSSSTPECSLGG